MKYFTKEYTAFLKELEKNNNRLWFNENKARFITHVKEPFQRFVEEMISRAKKKDKFIAIGPKEAMFRIYRDVRFSKDKRPYKTRMSAVVSRGGRKDHTYPGIYFEFGADRIRIYSGVYNPDREQLENIRKRILKKTDEFTKLTQDKTFKRMFGEIHGEQNKRIPKEFQETHKEQPLIANKAFYYYADLDPKKIMSERLPDLLMKYWDAADSLNAFFIKALK